MSQVKKTFEEVKFQDPKQMFEWIKTGHVSYRVFQEWYAYNIKEVRDDAYASGMDVGEFSYRISHDS